MPEIIDLTGPQNAYVPPLSEALSPDGTTLIDMTKPVEAKPDAAPEKPADKPPETPLSADDAKVEPPADAKADDEEVEPTADKTPPWMKAKITKAENRRRAAETKAAETDALLRKVLERVASPEPQHAAPSNEAPKPEGFSSPEKYAEAYIDWQVETRMAAAWERRESQRVAQEQARAAKERTDAFQTRADKVRAQHPDFDEICFSKNLPINDATAVAIVESDMGPDVHYYLATHLEEAAAIYQMSPVGSTRAVGRIEALLEQAAKAPKPEVSRAPKPISPVGSNNAVGKSPENETMAEYEARRSRELYPERYKRAGL